MPAGDYTIHQRVGSGAQGAVYRATHISTGETVAIKQIDVAHLNEKERSAVLSEVKVLATLSTHPHPNINLYRESFVEDPNLNIVLQWSANGSLLDVFNSAKDSKTKIEEDEIWNYFLGVALALDHVHGRQILHRDVKMANVFIHYDDAADGIDGKRRKSSVARVQLGDFGVSCILDDRSRAQTVVGTPYYLSPELCMGKKYSSKSDIWSLGVMLYVLINNKMPFEASNYAALILRIVQAEHAKQKMTYSPILHKLATWCMQKNDGSRPSARQILELPECQEAAARLGLALPQDLKVAVAPPQQAAKQQQKWKPSGGAAAAAATVKKRAAFNGNPAVPVRVSAPDRVQWRPSSGGVKNPQPRKVGGSSPPNSGMPQQQQQASPLAEDRPLPTVMRGQQALQRGHLPNRRTRGGGGSVGGGSVVQQAPLAGGSGNNAAAIGAPRNLYSRGIGGGNGRANRPLSGGPNRQGDHNNNDVPSSGYGSGGGLRRQGSGSASSRPPSVKDINAVASLPDYGGGDGSSDDDKNEAAAGGGSDDVDDEEQVIAQHDHHHQHHQQQEYHLQPAPSASSPLRAPEPTAAAAIGVGLSTPHVQQSFGDDVASSNERYVEHIHRRSAEEMMVAGSGGAAIVGSSVDGDHRYSDQTMGFLAQLSQGDPNALHVHSSLPEVEAACAVTWKVDDEEGHSTHRATHQQQRRGSQRNDHEHDMVTTDVDVAHHHHHHLQSTFENLVGAGSASSADVPLEDTGLVGGADASVVVRASVASSIPQQQQPLDGSSNSSMNPQQHFALAQHTITSTVRTSSSIAEDDELMQRSMPQPQETAQEDPEGHCGYGYDNDGYNELGVEEHIEEDGYQQQQEDDYEGDEEEPPMSFNTSLDASKTPMENLGTADVIAQKVDELLNDGENLVGPSVFAEVIDILSGGGGGGGANGSGAGLQGPELQAFVNARVPPEKVAELMYVCFRYLFLNAERGRMLAGTA